MFDYENYIVASLLKGNYGLPEKYNATCSTDGIWFYKWRICGTAFLQHLSDKHL